MLYARARVCAYYFAKSIRKVTQEHFDRDDFHPFCWTCDITRSIGFRPPAQKCFICSDKFRFCTHTGTRECTLTRSHTLAHSHTRTHIPQTYYLFAHKNPRQIDLYDFCVHNLYISFVFGD